MSILQDFYNGEVLPWEHFGGTDDVVYKTFSRKSAKLEESLRVNMDANTRKMQWNQSSRSKHTVGLSMMCYTLGKEERTCLGDFQLSGLMGK